MQPGTKAAVFLLVVGITGLVAESVWMTHEYASAAGDVVSMDRLSRQVALTAATYGVAFVFVALMASPRLAPVLVVGAWRWAEGRRLPLTLATSVVWVAVVVAFGIEDPPWIARVLFSGYPWIGILLSGAAFLDIASKATSARAPRPGPTHP